VPSIAVSVPPVDPLAGVALGLREQALALPGGTAASPWVTASAAPGNRSARSAGTLVAGTEILLDGASAPDGRLPALVGPRPDVASPFVRVAVVFDVLVLTAVASGALIVRRRHGFRLRRRVLTASLTEE
ncbi:MAG: hypothetical protein ACRDYF_03185, partial [Acidimicrobiia bacterium]